MEKSRIGRPVRKIAYRAGEIMVSAAENVKLAFDGLRNNYWKEVLRDPREKIEEVIQSTSTNATSPSENTGCRVWFGKGSYQNHNMTMESRGGYYQLSYTTPQENGFLEESFVHFTGTNDSIFTTCYYGDSADILDKRTFSSWGRSNDLGVSDAKEGLLRMLDFLQSNTESAHFEVPNKV